MLKSKCNKIQVHYQLEFDKPQAGYSCINYDMTKVEEHLTVSENLVDAPSKEKCCQENVKAIESDLVVNIQSE